MYSHDDVCDLLLEISEIQMEFQQRFFFWLHWCNTVSEYRSPCRFALENISQGGAAVPKGSTRYTASRLASRTAFTDRFRNDSSSGYTGAMLNVLLACLERECSNTGRRRGSAKRFSSRVCS